MMNMKCPILVTKYSFFFGLNLRFKKSHVGGEVEVVIDKKLPIRRNKLGHLFLIIRVLVLPLDEFGSCIGD